MDKVIKQLALLDAELVVECFKENFLKEEEYAPDQYHIICKDLKQATNYLMRSFTELINILCDENDENGSKNAKNSPKNGPKIGEK